MKKYFKILNIILLVICMVSIFLFSSEDRDTSTNTSIETTKKVISVVSNDEDTSTKIAKDYFNEVRKSAHLIEYFCLGILAINVLKDYHKINIWMVLICIIFCMLYALSDEIHQIYVPGRSCELRDIFIDTSGSIIGIIIYSLINFIYRKRYN